MVTNSVAKASVEVGFVMQGMDVAPTGAIVALRMQTATVPFQNKPVSP
jgi:hypothetical protein